MGVKQSKRSVDITEICTKGEIEGFGNEGKVEKIVDGLVEKVAANGHVDAELQNGGESHQNGAESIKNGEAPLVVPEKISEKKEDEVAICEGAINGQAEPGEINGETEKRDEEEKKLDDKKEKKKEKKDKEKKEKAVKKKFSFRNFSFSKKDKSKPSKEEKSPEKVDEAGNEDVPKTPETDDSIASPTSEGVEEVTKAEESVKIESNASPTAVINATAEKIEFKPVEAIMEIPDTVPATKASVEDVPPPLPVSPPPNETADTKMNFELVNSVKGVPETLAEHVENVTETVNSLNEKIESHTEILNDTEQIAMETGRQIEEKATNLLKTVEESMRNAGESVSQNAEEAMKIVENGLSYVGNFEANDKVLENMEKTEEILEEGAKSLQVDNLNGAPTSNTEETENKVEELGGGEDLAEVPKNLMEEFDETANTDSIESATLPPPPLEAAVGE